MKKDNTAYLDEKYQKKKARELAFEDWQFKSLENERNKPKRKSYFIVILALILLVDIIDNFTTNAPGNITSCFLTEFYNLPAAISVESQQYNDALSAHNGLLLITYAVGLLTPFYKALGDKYGRKPLFVASTIGMGFGLLVIYLCKSYVTFIIGSCITSFFLGHDIQILYILEVAPSKHRAKIYSCVKALGGLSSIMIPALRETLMENNASLWRNIYLLPAVSAFFIALLVFLFAKETDVFIKERYDYLQIPYDVRIQKAKEEKEKAKKSGIGPAIKYIFAHKELRALLIIKCIFDIAILVVQNFESIMKKDFAFTTEQISKAEYWFPIFYCIIVLISGVLADKIGRKKIILIFGGVVITAFSLFIYFCSFNTTAGLTVNPNLCGIMYGLYLGSYWIGRDYMEIMATEKVPTEIRSSIIGAFGLLVYSGMAIGCIANIIAPLFINQIWVYSLGVTVPAVLISIILLACKVKETKGVDYDSIVEAE